MQLLTTAHLADVKLFYDANKFKFSLKYTKLLKFHDKLQISVYDSSYQLFVGKLKEQHIWNM